MEFEFPTDGPAVYLVAAVAIGAAVFMWLYAKNAVGRRDALKKVATDLGLDLSSQDPFTMHTLNFDLFRKGQGGEIENVMYGTHAGREVKAFDFNYYVESRRQLPNGDWVTERRYVHHTCALVEVPAALPRMTIGPETLLSMAAGAVGFRDIQFESEEFNRRYRVRAEDKRFASYFCDPRMIAHLLDAPYELDYEIMGRRILMYTGRLAPSGWPPLLSRAAAFLDNIPSVVIEEHRVAPDHVELPPPMPMWAMDPPKPLYETVRDVPDPKPSDDDDLAP